MVKFQIDPANLETRETAKKYSKGVSLAGIVTANTAWIKEGTADNIKDAAVFLILLDWPTERSRVLVEGTANIGHWPKLTGSQVVINGTRYLEVKNLGK